MRKSDPSYHLTVVGDGDRTFIDMLISNYGNEVIQYHGSISDPLKLAPLFITSDIYVFPGDIGLGPIHALCYDLVPIVIDLGTHKPEYSYLNEKNAVVLPKDTTPEDYADAIDALFNNTERLQTLKRQSYPSIQHLTIKNMTKNLVDGISEIFLNKA